MTTDERLEQFAAENIRQFGFDAFSMLEHAQFHLSDSGNSTDIVDAINIIEMAISECWRANIGQL